MSSSMSIHRVTEVETSRDIMDVHGRAVYTIELVIKHDETQTTFTLFSDEKINLETSDE